MSNLEPLLIKISIEESEKLKAIFDWIEEHWEVHPDDRSFSHDEFLETRKKFDIVSEYFFYAEQIERLKGKLDGT